MQPDTDEECGVVYPDDEVVADPHTCDRRQGHFGVHICHCTYEWPR